MSDFRFTFDKEKGFSDLQIDGGDFLLSGAVKVERPNPNAGEGVYAYWNSLTHGLIITTFDDVGNEEVTNYFAQV